MTLPGPEPVKMAYNMPRASLPKFATLSVHALFCQAMHPLDFSTQGRSRLDVLRISVPPNLTYGTFCGTEIN